MRSDRNKAKKKIKTGRQRGENTSAVQADGTAVKKRYRLNVKRFLLFILALMVAVGIAVSVWAGMIIAKAPDIKVDEIESRLSQSTVIYDDSGKEIDKVFEDQNRTSVDYKDIPEDMVNALVALEDKTFWDHNGFNFIRIMGAIKDAVFGGGQVSGTSTITQQLARNVFLQDRMSEHSLERKIVEAYYTVIIERKMTKEEIITTYLNTVNFGNGSYGIQSAAQSYFSKDAKDLNLAQCAALAALPQAPSRFQLIEFVGNNDVSPKDENIVKRTPYGTYLANDLSKDRRQTCLELMLKQNYISQEQYDKTIDKPLKKILKPSYSNASARSAYFQDYVIDQVIEDLMKEKDWSYDEAWEKVYNGGLKIYSTLDSQAQDVIEKEFANGANFPGIKPNISGGVFYSNGQAIMYDFNTYFDDDMNFTFKRDEIIKKKDGGLVIKAGKRLNIYETEVNGTTDYSIEFKNLYTFEGGTLYSIGGGFVNIPQEFKSMNKKGNIEIPAKFMKSEEYKDFFTFNDDGTVSIPAGSYSLNQKVVQPQAAMTIVENSTGRIKAMVGGRKTTGRRLHNRAISPRQPGSSMKPLGVYASAIEQSAEEAQAGKKHVFTDFKIDKQGTKAWGNYLTAGSPVLDEPTTINGRVWPQNAGGADYGAMTLRTALQMSVNRCAVKVFLQVGADFAAKQVEKFGISTLDTEGEVNDLNPAALALGGMTNGVTTLDMASAYSTFPNNGIRKDTTSYTKVTNSKDELILDKTKTKSHKVLDSGVAWIMCDMLKSVVSRGIGGPAAISGVQVGGKTGTTDDEFDIWFDGFTPNYSAALWIGVDQNCPLTDMSGPAARLWGRIMNQIHAAKQGSYKGAPGNVVYSGGEYYISGTQGGAGSLKDLKDKEVLICTETGLLATPQCPHTRTEKFPVSGDGSENMPKYYCYKHNSNPEKYPINPDDAEKYQPKDPVLPPKEDPELPVDPENPDPDTPEPPVDPNPEPPVNPENPDIPAEPAA